MTKPSIGAQLYTCREFCKNIAGVAETFRKVKKIGYSNVQISGFGPVDVKDVARALEDTGVVCSCTHVSWTSLTNEPEKIIENHHLWKCRHAAIGTLPPEYYSEEGLKRFLGELPGVAEKLIAAGLDFSYHNHQFEFMRLGAGVWLDALYAQSNPRHLKAEIDTFWVQTGGGDPLKWVIKMSGREPLLHLKDYVYSAETREVRMTEIGNGNLDWPGILRAAEDGGVEYALVEQDDCFGRDPFESLAISYRYLKSIGYQ